MISIEMNCTYIQEIWFLKAYETSSYAPATKGYNCNTSPSGSLEAHSICIQLYLLIHTLFKAANLK